MAVRSPRGARILLAGLGCFLVLVGLMTWSFIGMWLAPPPPSPPVYLVDMSPGELAVAVGLGALPFLSLILILLGLSMMRMTYPEVGPRTTWSLGPVLLTPVRIAGVFVVVELLSLVAWVAIVAVGGSDSSNPIPAVLGWGVPFALGSFLMIASAEALRPLVSGREERVMFTAAVAALFGGVLLIGSGAVAILLGHESPPFLPWASMPAGLAGTFALVVLVRGAWHVVRQREKRPEAIDEVAPG